MVAYAGALEAHPEAMEVCSGVVKPTYETWTLNLEPQRLSLEPWRLTLEPRRLNLELGRKLTIEL
jgi:hypothetical protein